MIKFDVAVTVAEGSETKGGAGLAVEPVDLGSTGQSTNQNSAINRIQFDIPISYPDGTPKDA